MSARCSTSRRSATAVAATPVRKPHCKHCENINIRENAVIHDTTHWVSECVVLKNTVCLHCNKKGHTVSRCTNKRATSPNTRTAMVIITKNKTSAPIKKNVSRFSCLNEEGDSSDDEERPTPVVMKTPLPAVRRLVCPGAPDRASYLDALKRASVAKEVAKPTVFPEIDLAAIKTNLFRVKKHMNWADYTSSDEEDD